MLDDNDLMKVYEARLAEASAMASEAKHQINKLKNVRAAKVKPDYLFTIVSVVNSLGDRLYDNSCLLYKLTGMVKNATELRAVGKTPFEGSMTYLFNTLSGRIVMAVSGGTTFTNNPECFKELSEFLYTMPRGGDVTEIVNKYRSF
jgi:hypothetical protein